jgi:hypothetical protein
MVIKLREICPVWVTNIISIEDNFKMIADFGKLFNKRTEAQKWNDKLAFALADFCQFVADKPIRKAAYFIWKNPYMAAGSDNYINEMLKLNHFENIYENKSRYPEVEIKKIRLEGDRIWFSCHQNLIRLRKKTRSRWPVHAPRQNRICRRRDVLMVRQPHVKALDYFRRLHHRLGT